MCYKCCNRKYLFLKPCLLFLSSVKLGNYDFELDRFCVPRWKCLSVQDTHFPWRALPSSCKPVLSPITLLRVLMLTLMTAAQVVCSHLAISDRRSPTLESLFQQFIHCGYKQLNHKSSNSNSQHFLGCSVHKRCAEPHRGESNAVSDSSGNSDTSLKKNCR